jgi:hypothetical protein
LKNFPVRNRRGVGGHREGGTQDGDGAEKDLVVADFHGFFWIKGNAFEGIPGSERIVIR